MNHYFIVEQIDINGHEFTDHALVKAVSEDEAKYKWKCFYSSYPAEDDRTIDAGDYEITLAKIHEVKEEEYKMLQKYFMEIE